LCYKIYYIFIFLNLNHRNIYVKKLLLFLFLSATILGSCSKKENVQPKPAVTLTIDGITYNTVVIGNKIWTSENYNGPGGLNYDNGTNSPAYGMFLTAAQSRSITLTPGWRLPTLADYYSLVSAVGIPPLTSANNYYVNNTLVANLRDKTSWLVGPGTNSSGFNATATGCFSGSSFTPFEDFGGSSEFITASDDPTTGEPENFIISGNTITSRVFLSYTGAGTVRFVKDN
jgi:uncharacterized protein (TIGR02145 family)